MKKTKFPRLSQWKQLFKVLKGPERKLFLVFFALAFLSATYFAAAFYLNNTATAPGYGGEYTEGVVGQPRFINPIYGETNDVDRTLVDLVYSGLMTYDKDGQIVPDLVESYEVQENGRTYVFQLKDNLFWQDGIRLTADDVIFTIKTIQNSDFKSPLRANWLDVYVEKLSEKSFSLSLNSPYNSFLENLTLKIIPQHIWRGVLPENFGLSSYNLKPVGSGLYIISGIQEENGFIKGISLKANQKHHGKVPYISKLNLRFFSDKDGLLAAANQKQIDGFPLSYLDNDQSFAEKQVRQGWTSGERFNVYNFTFPRYFAVFFNANSPDGQAKFLADADVRQALNYSVDKQELSQKISDTFKSNVSLASSPVMAEYFGYSKPKTNYVFDLEVAKKLLDKAGYKETEDGQREKPNDKKAAFQFKSYLSSKSSGSEVVELQKCLAKLDETFKALLKNDIDGKYGKGTEAAVTAFQEKYLAGTSATGEVGPGTRTKLNELCFASQNNSSPLQITITTINQPQLIMTANLIKEYWQKAGVAVDINIAELSELKTIIKGRNYQALLYGQALGSLPDLYPFWHSTQVRDPGLNLAGYQNKKVDQLLKEARETLDETLKIQKYEELQEIMLADAPALFLYNPNYIYWASEKVKGIETTKITDPSKRFQNIENWYIKTKRVWK